MDDLISEGNMGLVMAAEKYDAAKGIPFEKFASSWIRSSITAGLAAHSRPIKLNKAENHQLKQLNKMQRQFETSEERRPSVSEMAQLTKIRQKEVAVIMLASMRHKSVDAPL